MSALLEYMEDFSDEEKAEWAERESLRLTKTCKICEVDLPLKCFPKHSQHKDRLDTRCKSCIKKNSRITDNLKKVAPPKPEFCQCCGNIPRKGKNGTFVLDHDHETSEIRGWVCDFCNTALGRLGDNVEGLRKALEYLLEDKTAYNTRNIYMIRNAN